MVSIFGPQLYKMLCKTVLQKVGCVDLHYSMYETKVSQKRGLALLKNNDLKEVLKDITFINGTRCSTPMLCAWQSVR